jgi:hypothetical protein
MYVMSCADINCSVDLCVYRCTLVYSICMCVCVYAYLCCRAGMLLIFGITCWVSMFELLAGLVSKSFSSDSMCSTMSSSIGPYSSSYWCSHAEELGAFKIYGKVSRTCTEGHVNTSVVQVDTYGGGGNSCGGEVMQTEMLPLGVCLPMISGSFKLTVDSSSMSGNIQYAKYSDRLCSMQSSYATSIITSMCSNPFSGSGDATAMIKMYIVNDISEVMAPPPGSVVETVYPTTESSSTCQSGDGVGPMMVRYLRPGACLVGGGGGGGSSGQFVRMTCGSTPSKYFLMVHGAAVQCMLCLVPI